MNYKLLDDDNNNVQAHEDRDRDSDGDSIDDIITVRLWLLLLVDTLLIIAIADAVISYSNGVITTENIWNIYSGTVNIQVTNLSVVTGWVPLHPKILLKDSLPLFWPQVVRR